MNWLNSFFKKEKQNESEKVVILKKLKELRKICTENIKGNNKLKKEFYFNQIDKLINELIEEKRDDLAYYRKELKESEESIRKIDKDIQVTKETWEEVKPEIEKIIKESVDFIGKTSFYPPEYAFDINKLKGDVLEIDEDLEEEEVIEIKEVKEKAETLQKNIESFKKVHKKTNELIEKIEKQGTKNEEVNDIKHELFVYLQQGKIRKAEKMLKKLKRTL